MAGAFSLYSMKKFQRYASTLFLAAALLSGCKDEEGNTNQVEFDQQAMLQNYGEKLIFPGYADLNTKTTALQGAVTAFTQDPAEGKSNPGIG